MLAKNDTRFPLKVPRSRPELKTRPVVLQRMQHRGAHARRYLREQDLLYVAWERHGIRRVGYSQLNATGAGRLTKLVVGPEDAKEFTSVAKDDEHLFLCE